VLPVGSRADATLGKVKLTSSLQKPRRRTQTATLSGGAFVVRQPRSGHGLTELTMTGGDFTQCSAAGARARTGAHAAAARIRRLFGNAHGRFRTRGRYSTATVRGTTWSVEDRCDGTLTRVTHGSVTVFDLVKRRTVTLHSGQHYLARRGNR
jgi:hypothetical protein